MPVQKIGEILQRLVSEDISIRNLRAILEALIARRWGRAREALVRHIRAQKPILLRILRTGDPGSNPAESGR